jgi:hypothetical protein
LTTTLDIPCAKCGALAMHIETTAPGDPLDMPRGLPPGEPGITAHAVGVRTVAGTQTLWTAVSEMAGGIDAVRAAIPAGDVGALMAIDREIVPFYCRECAASYCEAHWTTWEIHDPEWTTWFEELRGRCPEGHERRIYD